MMTFYTNSHFAGIFGFKTPLDEQYNAQIPEAHRWSMQSLIAAHPTLTAVISLANTARFYRSDVLAERGIFYASIECEG